MTSDGGVGTRPVWSGSPREDEWVIVQSAQPSGTVTFLFTDVEGSTRLWEQRREAMRVALERHDEIVRSAIEFRGGYVFSTAGDAFSAAFATPGEAVAAAVDAQRALQAEPWPDGAGIQVRMGIHVGVADQRDGDYFGPAVNRSARLMGLARGGQMLVSLAVEELVRDDLASGVGLRALGEHKLRGLSRPETVFQVVGPGVAHEFPPLESAALVPGNLPSPVSSFVGRLNEVKELAAALDGRRLVTLVGPGGVGKTRLAIATAATLADAFPDGTWFVELAPIGVSDAVVHAVASTLSVLREEDSTMLESVVGSLAGRRALVVLDNCEHLIDAAAEIALAIGQGAAPVTVMATSREPLGVSGEQVWPVGPLDPAIEAVELFVERARSVNPSFALAGSDDRDALAGLCVRLDGIPLAVELAD